MHTPDGAGTRAPQCATLERNKSMREGKMHDSVRHTTIPSHAAPVSVKADQAPQQGHCSFRRAGRATQPQFGAGCGARLAQITQLQPDAGHIDAEGVWVLSHFNAAIALEGCSLPAMAAAGALSTGRSKGSSATVLKPFPNAVGPAHCAWTHERAGHAAPKLRPASLHTFWPRCPISVETTDLSNPHGLARVQAAWVSPRGIFGRPPAFSDYPAAVPT